MTQNASPDTTAGDPTPELTQSSLIKAVTMLNKIGYNIEIPNAGVVGPIQMKRGVVISSIASPPTQVAGYGMQFTVSQGSLRSTLLQQSVNTNDERLYLLNNASPTSGAYSGTFIYDKAGAAASYYAQTAGYHSFATAPVAGAVNNAVTFTERVKIDPTGMTVVAGNMSITNGALYVSNNAGVNQLLANFLGPTNGSNLTINSVKDTNGYVQGSLPGDTAVRVETNNLCLGALAGNITIGTSTRILGRFNTNGTVLIPGTNSPSSTYGGFSVGNGVTITVGAGNDNPSDAKAFWIYNNQATLAFTGGGMQLNANNGLDFWTGNAGATAWIRPLQIQTGGKVLVGGIQSATAIGDLHINQNGFDSSGSLSLTGASNTSYFLMGNRDSGGTAGPNVIWSGNRVLSFGAGTSFTARSGGTLTATMTVNCVSQSVGIQITNPETYGPLAVNITNGSAIAQVGTALNSPSTLGAAGTLAGGLGIYWGNIVFTGMRAVTGGDGNNVGLALMVGNAGSSVEGARVDLNSRLTVRGDTIFLGTATTNTISSDGANNTYVRGNMVVLQSTSGSNYLTATTGLVTLATNTLINGNLQVNNTLVTARQIETTTDKVLSAGVQVFDYATNSVWMCTNPPGNFTPNFTNVPSTAGQVVTITLIVFQGATGYSPTAIQISGVAVTVKWAGGMAPVPTPGNMDVFVFSLVRTTSNTWVVLASATPYV